jgi:hypothetical protein
MFMTPSAFNKLSHAPFDSDRTLPDLLRARQHGRRARRGSLEPWDFIRLGTHELKGKEERTEVYTIDDDLVSDSGNR